MMTSTAAVTPLIACGLFTDREILFVGQDVTQGRKIVININSNSDLKEPEEFLIFCQ